MKFIKDPFEFFIMSNYNFSLFGAIIGFFLMLILNIKVEKSNISKYIDPVVLSFLFVLPLGYLGSLFGGQVYGRETLLGIEILYTHSYTLVPYQVPIFPLPIIYAIVSFLIFCGLYILSMFIHIRGFIGYMGLFIFSCSVLILEYFSGKYDIISSTLPFNMNQVIALGFIIFSGYRLFQIYMQDEASKDVVSIK